MAFFASQKVGFRLGIGYGTLLVLMALLVLIGLSRMSLMQRNLDSIVNRDFAQITLVNTMRDSIRFQSIALRDIVLQEDLSFKKHELQLMKEARQRYLAAVESLLKTLKSDTSFQNDLSKFRDAESSIQLLVEQTIDRSLADDHAAARAMVRDQVRQKQTELVAQLDTMQKYLEGVAQNSALEANSAYDAAFWFMLAMTMAALIIGVLLALHITRGLLKQLGGEPVYASEIAQKVAQGDMSIIVVVKDGDKTSLIRSLKTMIDSLKKLVGEVRTGADSIATTSREISAGNSELTQRTQEQASFLEETAASMEELTSTVKQNADNAKQASRLAVGAREVAGDGVDVVHKVVGTMASINQGSKKIADIISVINEIAFQTNILALNAAVEAARAGEQGKGFSVVASEVRNLAQRSAAAAKEIEKLIESSVAQVGDGAKLVAQAGETMEKIVASVERVANIVEEISTASAEQSNGIEQVSQSIAQMDQITQKNAVMVEEVSAAAKSMEDQSQIFYESVKVFKLENKLSLSRANVAPFPPTAAPLATSDFPVAKTENIRAPKSRKKTTSLKAGTGTGDWTEF